MKLKSAVLCLLLMSCGVQEHTDLFRMIDNLNSAVSVSTGADEFLSESLPPDERENKLYQSESLVLSSHLINDRQFINIISYEEGWEGIYYLMDFGGGQIEYDLTFCFNSHPGVNEIQHFGFYVLADRKQNALLGIRLSRQSEKRLRLGYVLRAPDAKTGTVSLNRELEHLVFETNPDELHSLHVTVNEKALKLRIDNALDFSFPVLKKMKNGNTVFFPFARLGNASFRIDSVVIDGTASPGVLQKALNTIGKSNLRKLRSLYKNEDFPVKEPGGSYIYKIPVRDEYRNALLTVTPASFEFAVPEFDGPAYIQFGYALLDQSWARGDAVIFQVIAKKGGSEKNLFEQLIDSDFQIEHNTWADALVPLNEPYTSIEFRVTGAENGSGNFAVLSNPVYFEKHEESRHPNVLLLSLDTVRWDRLSFMGYSRKTTPNLDRIAREGVFFSQCISQASWTTPSHFSIMTSQYPSIHGVIERMSERYKRLSPDKITLAEILRGNGYNTAAIVANSPVIAGKLGFYQGFNRYMHNGSNGDPHDIEALMTRSIALMNDEGKHRPFFLFLHTFETHLPFTNTFYAGETVDYTDEEQHKKYRSDLYDGDLHYTDEQLDRLFCEMDELGILDNTVVIITSDHGYVMPGEKGAYEGYSDNLYEAAVRVPFIIRFPGAVIRNSVIHDQVRSIDIAPTVLDLLDIKGCGEFQGTSLLPLLKGQQIEPLVAFAEAMNRGPERKMVRTPLFKYIFIPEMAQARVAELTELGYTVDKRELYNLEEDSREQRNLVRENPEAVASFQKLTDSFIRAGERRESGKDDIIVLSESDVKRLKALGYIK